MTMEQVSWWLIPRNCAKCGREFLPKVKAQKYCDEHRYLAGAPIRLLKLQDSAGDDNG